MRLLLLRHAKSSWDHPGLSDHDRPLARRGKRAAAAMGVHFAGSDLRIDRIVSSTAERALSTARLFREAFDPGVPMTSRGDLYHADPKTLLEVACKEAGDDEGARILLVAHNPGMHDLALLLRGDGEPEAVARLRAKFPTGALAEFDLPGRPTMERGPQEERLLRFVRPKDLPKAGKLRL